MESKETPEANTPLNITVTSGAKETMTWRTLARQAVPMLTRPEQFHVSQRRQLAQTICLLLSGDLELEHVACDADEAYAPDAGKEGDADSPDSDAWKEPW